MTFFLLYWKWIAAAAVIAALTIGYNVHVNGLIKDAVTEAVTERDGAWRESEEKAIAKAKAEAAATEKAHAVKLAAIQSDFQKEKGRADKADAARIAAVRSGSRLRIATGCTSTADVPNPASPAAGSDAPPTAQFLGEADSAFLIGEAARADQVVLQLQACQAVILSDRRSP